MLDDIFSTQSVADQLKPLIQKVRGGGGIADRRRQVMKLLQSFERCSWHTRAFEDAMAQVEAGRFAAVDARHIGYEGSDVLSASTQLLTAYLESVCSEELPPSDLENKQTFSTAEAAAYLKIAESTIRKHVYETGELVGSKIGHSLVFSRAELDAFAAKERQPGRPRKTSQT